MSSPIIKVASLEIQTDKLIKEMKATKDGIAEISEENKRLAKVGKQSSEAFIQNEAALKTLRSEYSNGIKTLNAVTQAQQNLTTAVSKEIQTVDQAKQNNKALVAIRNQVNTSTVEGRKQIESINKKMDENTNLIKGNVSNLEKQKINIGNYKSAVEGLNPELGRFSNALTTGKALLKDGAAAFKQYGTSVTEGVTQIRTAKAGTEGLTKAQTVSTVATNLFSGALKVLKFALIATGIGAIVVVLGSLVGMLANTQKGTDFVSKAMTALGTAFSVIVDRVSDFGGALVKFFSGDFTGGFNDMKAALSGIGDEMRREAGLAYELEAALQSLRDAEIGAIASTAERRKEIARLKLESRDQTLSLKERVQALDQANKLDKQILSEELERAKERARISQQQTDLGESSAEELKANEELKAAVFQLEERQLTREKEIVSERTSLINQTRAAQKAQADARQKEVEAENKRIEEQRQKELEGEKEFQARKKALQDEQRLRDANDEQERAIIKEELRLENELLELENIQISELQKNELRKLLEQEHQDAMLQIQMDSDLRKKEEQDKMFADYLAKQKASNNLIVQQEQAKAQAVSSVASKLTGILQGFLGDTLAAQLTAIAVDTAIQVIAVKSAASASAARNIANATAALPPPFNVPLIVAAGAQNVATLGAASAAVGSILGQGALSGLGAIAGNLQNSAKKSRGAQETFAKGGILRGPSHSNGGISTPYGELEGGEAVINKRSTRMYGSLLSGLNVAGGGRSFADGGIIGSTSSQSTQLIDYDRMAMAFKAGAESVRHVVSVEEINTVGNRVRAIENSATF